MFEARQCCGKQSRASAEGGGAGACGGGVGRGVHTEHDCGAELKTAVDVEPAWLVLQ